MAPDPEGVLIFGGLTGLAGVMLGPVVLVNGHPLVGVVAVLVGLAGLTMAVGAWWLPGHNVGRPQDGWKPALLHRLSWVFGTESRGCGCLYAAGISHSAPKSEWVERERVWARDEAGAGGRVRFIRTYRGLKRCHNCGHHYHHVEMADPGRFTSNSKVKECWPEEEPDTREDLPHGTVVDREVLRE